MGDVGKLEIFIGQNYKYPRQQLKASAFGKIIVKFRVTERGSVDSIHVVKSPGFGADEEIIQVIKLTSGKWKPGRKDGKTVAMFYSLPIDIDPE